eukprot:scaffold545_cov372-Pavlova_lutheri.AAC.34
MASPHARDEVGRKGLPRRRSLRAVGTIPRRYMEEMGAFGRFAPPSGARRRAWTRTRRRHAVPTTNRARMTN